MRTIRDPNDLQRELTKLIRYASTERPSRKRIASTLSVLSTRLAAEDPKAVIKQVERALKSKFPNLTFVIDEDEDLGVSLLIEPRDRDPESSVVHVNVVDDESSVSVHSYGSSRSSTDGTEFGSINVQKLISAAEKLVKKYVA